MIKLDDVISAGIESIVYERVKQAYKSLYETIIYLETQDYSPEDILERIRKTMRDIL